MLLSIDTCQNRVSADQYQVIVSHIKFRAHRGHVLFLSGPLHKFWFSIGSRAQLVDRAGLFRRGLTLTQVKNQPNNNFFVVYVVVKN